eukprot:221905-Heterocapsa_arctica.AAC.1
MIGRRRLLHDDPSIVDVTVVVEEDLVEVAERKALCPLEVAEARRVAFGYRDDARGVVLLHDA